MGFLQDLWKWRSQLIFVITPLILLPLPVLVPTPEARVAYTMLLMAVYWVSEALPIGVTSLIPVVLIPAFNIISSKDLCPAYFEDSNMLFIGGLILAICVEYWDLHKRIALKVLQVVGVQPRCLLLGFIMPTWFMSMWISNTATTAMMLPIVDAVLHELMRYDRMRKQMNARQQQKHEANQRGYETVEMGAASSDQSGASNGDISPVTTPETALAATDEVEAVASADDKAESVLAYIQDPENRDFANICKMLTVATAYGANIGGTATLTGTSPNLVLNNNIFSNFGNQTPFNFGTWFAYAFPISLVSVLVAWLWLQILFLGPRSMCKCSAKNKDEVEAVQLALKKEYEKLGPITFPEVSCIVLFGITIIMWVTREPGGDGWGNLFSTTPVTLKNDSNGNLTTVRGETKFYMGDAQPAILMSILLFVFPSSNPFRRRKPIVDVVFEETVTTKNDGTQEVKRTERTIKGDQRPTTLLSWSIVHKHLPWGIVLLLGGGFALAKATKESGLSAMIGDQLKPLGQLPLPLLIIIVVFCTTLVTEITSNTATASILLPILVDLSRSIGINPLTLMLPCTMAASFAFNLPVATPPNSIVFGKGYLTVPDMMKSGFMLTITSGFILVLGTLTHGAAIFDFWNYPSWANGTVKTAVPGISGFALPPSSSDSAGAAVASLRAMYVGNE